MTCSVSFVGHVSVDRVENVNGVNTQPGGAALHAAVAARTLIDDAFLFSVTGRDYPFTDVLDLFPRAYIKTSKIPSTRFSIRYDERWEAHYIEADYGAGARISPSTIPTHALTADSVVHISPLPPVKVERIVNRIRDASPETKISVNTWIGYIKGRRNRRILKNLASNVDFFIVNDSEAKALTEAESLSIALRLLRAKTLVVTLGEFGAIINTESGEVQMVPALRFPIEKVVDTTGAGDAWCGAFSAAYRLTEDFVKSVTAASVISSIKCTGWGCSRLVNLKFKNVDQIAEYVIGLKEGSLQKRILDFT
ncbi:MAG: carbohydrate kinase family protein [Candidatus Bathyarchaeota archaeon]|nr:carbohydrate kinase family protein [Candidatus Bathyarchaeota archaeon]